MKRRITVEQLQELTEEQQQRLREWWKPQYYDVYAEYDGCLDCYEEMTATYPKQPDQNDLPLLDIGQMIELLENLQFDWFDEICTDEGVYPQPIKGDNLCDALWQAVKQVL